MLQSILSFESTGPVKKQQLFYMHSTDNFVGCEDDMDNNSSNFGLKQKATVNFLNIRTPKKFVVLTLKFELLWLYHRVMSPNDADGMANSVDPDQTAPLGAV